MSTASHSEEFSISDARNDLGGITDRVEHRGKRIVLTRRGKQVAALVPIEDLEALQAIEDEIDLEDARVALADVKKRGSIPLETIKKKLGL